MTTTTIDLGLELSRIFRVASSAGRLALHALANLERLVIHTARDAVAVGRDADALYTSAVTSATRLHVTARATPRLLRILEVATQVAAGYRLHRAHAEIVGTEAAAPALQALHLRSATRVHALCVELRGPILKLAQLASCRPDLLPAPWITVLATLQDQVPMIAFDAIRSAVEAELGAPLDTLFASFEPEPLATASLAQVHGAVLHGGRRVVVKVRLPGIAELFETDLTALRALSSVLVGLVPGDVLTTITELCRSMRTELDFSHEADSAEQFAAIIGSHAGVRVPAVVRDHSTRAVLTLERSDGERLTAFLARDAGGPATATVIAALVGSVCRQVLADGLVHADLHPGNILVEPPPDADPSGGPVVVLLDFGATLTLAPARRAGLARLALAILQDDAPAMATWFDRLGFRTASGDNTTLVALGRELMAPFRSADGCVDIDPDAQMRAAIAALRADDVTRIPEDFVLLGRVLASLAGLVMHHARTLDLSALLLPPLSEALAVPV